VFQRIRTIKPEFFKHEQLYDLEKETNLPIRLAFAGLWTCCDRHGRFRWRPRTLKADILPHDAVDFSRVLDAWASRGFVVKYTSKGEEFGYIPSWSKHQFINNKEKGSDIPPPVVDGSSPRSDDQLPFANEQVDATGTRSARDHDATGTREVRESRKSVKERKGKEGKGKEYIIPDDQLETGNGNGQRQTVRQKNVSAAAPRAFPTPRNLPAKTYPEVDAILECFCRDYPAHRIKGRENLTYAVWESMHFNVEQAGKMYDTMLALKITANWTKEFGAYVPWADKFLESRQWDASPMQHEKTVLEVQAYFLLKSGQHQAVNELTPTIASHIAQRYTRALDVAKDRDPKVALQFMTDAIDACLESRKNGKRTSYPVSLEHVFGTAEDFQKWLKVGGYV